MPSEFRAYIYIKERLVELSWNTENPDRAGDVYTQHEALKNPLIKKYLVRDVPENIVVVRQNKFMVIEAKGSQKKLQQAVDEAKAYADKLNKDRVLCPIAIAVAGNPEEKYRTKNFYFKDGKWHEIIVNDKIIGGLPSKDIAQQLVDNNIERIDDLHISDDILYGKATKINEILHIGSINKNDRARIMAALLLAMADDTPINTDASSASVLTGEINAKVEKILSDHGKKDFAPRIIITPPTTPDNHVKFKQALVNTIQELEDLNIRSALNSGTDVLGRFYEVFLKYGNGAKEIGIVLTPRHITTFAANAVRVNKHDKVFDPACGTGGFLVAAFDRVRKTCNDAELDKFKTGGIYGIDQDADVLALALVNMIFRGDGKNNIVEGNSLADKNFKDITMTKILMNPPFALKKEDEKEYKFVDYALEKTESGGLLFAIVPSPIMFRANNYKRWRENLLTDHTLKAVIKLPEDLFYPVGVHASAIVVEAQVPHDFAKPVLWARLDDGFRKKKGVRKEVVSAPNNMEAILSKVHAVLDGHSFSDKPKEWILAPILKDRYLECAPEQYLNDEEYSEAEVSDSMKRVLLNATGSLMTRNVL